MTEDKKPNFMDAIKAAQAQKKRVPQATSAKVQQAKFNNQGLNSRPVKRSGARGG
jgi:hypothetical protein